MLTIFSVSITIYLQQLHLNLIYIDMHQDGINYSQIHLYQNTSNKYDTHIIHKYVDGRAGGSYVGEGGLASETTSPQGGH